MPTLVSVDPKDFSCKGFFLRHPCLMSNALTVVSAILFRPYRFSSSNETGFNIKFIKNKLQGVSMQVRVNPNHVFKRMIRAWLKRWIRLAVWAASRSFKRAKVLNAEKNGGVGFSPKVHLTWTPIIFPKSRSKTRRTLLFDKHFSCGVIYPCVHGLSPLYTDQ